MQLLGLSIIRSVRNNLVIYRATVIMLDKTYQQDCETLREAFEFAQGYLDSSKDQWRGEPLSELKARSGTEASSDASK